MGVRLASWNVHAWIGGDGARDPERTFERIRELGADVLALQEVEGWDWRALALDAGYLPVIGHTRPRLFGNALLVRVPLLNLQRVDLSVAGREARGALDAVVRLPNGPLRVVATHLGLRAAERRWQAVRLAQHVESEDVETPVVLLGDLNDWTPGATQVAALARAVGPLTRLATFPSRQPVLPLDQR